MIITIISTIIGWPTPGAIYINRTRTSTPNALMECGGFGTCDRTTGIHINRWIELYQNQI